ncbi:DoxX-like family protein [Mucilaginibacter pineti]|uniref:DoxX-like family protein n=1 Tax=Mucilaginibacter pineti TaxID=1391627 RepID=A0A1G6Z898_9SPHI|nr:DoxX family protein [Mucilaginibacter pineti]SDD98217.1 DoxX-like family protein [Mucilaginibacter pineti]
MKKDKIIYWITTTLVAFSGLIAGITYIMVPAIADEFKHLGFPDYFRKELATAKILGALVIVLPMVAGRIKEWAYAGFAITFISACIAHTVQQGAATAIPPFVTLIVLVISYVYYTKVNAHNALAGL